MLCAAGRPLSLITWLAVPLLFSSAVLGLTGLAGLLVGAVGREIALSTPVFGAATAVTAVASGTVRWTGAWQRNWLRWPYLATVLTAGVLLGGVEVPVLAVIAIGVPSTVWLSLQCVLERRRSEALAESGEAPTPSGCGYR
jgi:hypothetical protein